MDAPAFQEGVFFHMPEEQYFATPALSASGIKQLRMSPLDYWARTSWLNPNYQEPDEVSVAKRIGKAYDKRITEGKAAFEACYAPSITPADYPGVLTTVDDIKERLRAHKESGRDVKISHKRKEDFVTELLSHEPDAKVWDLVRHQYEAMHAGKELISPDLIESIEIAAAMIEKHPKLSLAFSGGAPQVSVFWTCPVVGVPCKARFDYLKPKAIVDLKTVSNPQELPLEQAIAREIGFRRYHIQAWWYLDAAKHIARFIREGLSDEKAPEYFPLGKALMEDHAKNWLWIFQFKGIAPVAIGRTLPTESILMNLAQAECETAKQTYRTYLETYGTSPWVDQSDIAAIDDTAVPSWSLA